MQLPSLSDIFGVSALVSRTIGVAVQSRFPGAHTRRLSSIPTHVVTAVSYDLADALTPAVAYTGAATRAALLSTKLGQKFKNTVTAVNIAVTGAVTAAFYESARDGLAFGGTLVATYRDYQGQGRRQRLPDIAGRVCLWLPMAYAYGNRGMLISDGVALLIDAVGIYRHDIKNAAGQNKSFLQNLKAYWHGVHHDSATGADIEGQVITAAGHQETAEEQYTAKLKNGPVNPYFDRTGLTLET
jgi:hypothetical protein